jgi:hypothetical protein
VGVAGHPKNITSGCNLIIIEMIATASLAFLNANTRHTSTAHRRTWSSVFWPHTPPQSWAMSGDALKCSESSGKTGQYRGTLSKLIYVNVGEKLHRRPEKKYIKG